MPRRAHPRVPALLRGLIVAAALGAAAPATAHAARERLTVAEQYELGLRYMKRGYYVKAMEQFNRIRNYHRDDPYAIKAELAIADLHFKKNEWDQARIAYEDFMRRHPRHPDLDYVVYRIGMCLYKKAPKAAGRDQTWTRQAVNTWTGFEARFPDSAYRDEVAERLTECRERLARKELLIARFYERRRAWRAVEGRARGLLASWPDSRYVPEGLDLLAEAVAWQGDPNEATALVERLRQLDPERADRVAARVERAVARR